MDGSKSHVSFSDNTETHPNVTEQLSCNVKIMVPLKKAFCQLQCCRNTCRHNIICYGFCTPAPPKNPIPPKHYTDQELMDRPSTGDIRRASETVRSDMDTLITHLNGAMLLRFKANLLRNVLIYSNVKGKHRRFYRETSKPVKCLEGKWLVNSV